jgi:menaquinol-cytochrome c reductase cytochrome b/c subunit
VTEIPEHLRKRAAEARKKAAEKSGGDAPAADAGATSAAAPSSGGEEAPASAAASRIPAHLLERSKAAKARTGDGGGGGTATATATPAAAAAATAVATAAPPAATGPGGHTQRLLTVVKSGSIQDVKARPQDKVHTWPHLLVVEFVASLAITAFTLIFSIFVNAPLLALANVNQTPNPSKAPWYFLGLQELLTMFHPMVAGVTIPGVGLFALILAPYTDRNPSQKPEDRKFAIALFTLFLMFWAVLVLIGSFFRGPGFNFIFPWNDGLFFEL